MTAEESAQDVDGQLSLSGGTAVGRWLAQTVIELALAPGGEAFDVVEERA